MIPVPLQHAPDQHPLADVYMVERLTSAINQALERSSVPGLTTPAEILSALCTSLTRFLSGARHQLTPEDGQLATHEVRQVLSELLLRFGTIPN